MANIKTPVLKAFREKGGTFCTFNSAIEDIGLNINEKGNKVRLSHYAILDIPNCNYSNTNNNNNVFNLLSPYATMQTALNDNDENNTVNNNIAQAFMSYALNMESVIRNQKNYDFTTHLSVSERVFWKWLKECGAIRWDYASKYNEGEELENEINSNYFIEDRRNEYNKVVKSFGKIDAVTQRSSDCGLYNEVYVNIPTSFGAVKNVFFKQVEDNNYKFNTQYKAHTQNFFNLEGYEDKNKTEFDTGLKNLGYFDYANLVGKNAIYKINGKEGYWFQPPIGLTNHTAFYITDDKIATGDNLNDVISIEKDNNSFYSFTRSRLDCMTLELDCNNIAKILDVDNITYDELNTKDGLEKNLANNYNFNTILIYYSIFDDNNNILATNLYGVYFIDSPQAKSDSYKYNSNFKDFEFPRLVKKQSTTDGFGTSYSFRLNIRTTSIFDDKDSNIYDNSSADNSIITDFNNVISSLNNTINLLTKYTKNTEILKNKYEELYNLFSSINDKLIILEQGYESIKKYNEDIKYIKEKLNI